MDESNSSSIESGGISLFMWIIVIVLVVYVSKIYLRDNQYRPDEACYVPYIILNFFYVDAFGYFMTDDDFGMIGRSLETSEIQSLCLKHTTTFFNSKIFQR
ncbi:MAG: hypothetical protein V3T17_19300 [Pseudomonadales bacterium]